MEEIRNACKSLDGKAEKKRTLGRQRHRGWNGFEVDHVDIWHKNVHRTYPATDRNQ
jgi:hypothetical protein